MRTRRAALFVALVLGISALAASLSAPPRRQPPPPPPPTVLRDAEAAQPARVRLDAGRERPGRVAVKRGRRAELVVEVPAAADVAIEDLGLVTSADPRTPAVFDLYTAEPGRFPIVLRPVEGREREVGTLTIRR